MRVISLITLLVLLSIFQVDAQTTEYQLRVLTAEDYIIEIAAITTNTLDGRAGISQVIGQEFELRYGDIEIESISVESLEAFHQVMGLQGLPNWRDWFSTIIQLSLDYDTVLSADEIATDGFNFAINPIDFNGDSQLEALLEVSEIAGYWHFYAVLNHDNSVDILPVPITNFLSNIPAPISGFASILRIADLDTDNDEELIIEISNYGNWSDCRNYYVIDWQSGSFVNMSGGLLQTCDPYSSDAFSFTTEFTQLPHAIQTLEYYRDGWNCEISDTDIVDLERGIARTISIYADTVWCDMRFASIAFDNEDYTTAIELYSQILPQIDGELAQYIASRLVLSYMLSDATGEALLLFESIEPHGQMGDLLIALRAGYPDATMMCQIAFDFFWDINSSTRIDDTDRFANPYEWTPPYFYFGGPTPNDPRYYPQPSPHIAGCNINEISPANIIEYDSTAITFNNARSFASYHIDDLLINGEYHEVLRRIDEFLTSDIFDYENGNCKPCYSQQLRYWRGLTLSLMGDETGALTEYISLAEDYPMSYWGQLASIHFEVIP